MLIPNKFNSLLIIEFNHQCRNTYNFDILEIAQSLKKISVYEVTGGYKEIIIDELFENN